MQRAQATLYDKALAGAIVGGVPVGGYAPSANFNTMTDTAGWSTMGLPASVTLSSANVSNKYAATDVLGKQ